MNDWRDIGSFFVLLAAVFVITVAIVLPLLYGMLAVVRR